MPTQTDLDTLIAKLAAAIPELGLNGKEQEEYCTMLLRLQHQLDCGKPSEATVSNCLAYFSHRLRRGSIAVSPDPK
jgi:hypothetical protein